MEQARLSDDSVEYWIDAYRLASTIQVCVCLQQQHRSPIKTYVLAAPDIVRRCPRLITVRNALRQRWQRRRSVRCTFDLLVE